jgi:Fe-S-cluster containining protein
VEEEVSRLSTSGQGWQKYLRFRCTGCGNCCRDTVVLLTDADVARISAGTGKRPEEFVRFFAKDAVEMDQRHPLWVRFDQGRAVMGLKWRGSACTFLRDDNLCGIYEHRPVVCREHPFNVTLSDTGKVERIALSRVVHCPHEWDGKSSLGEIRAVVRWNERQSDVYTGKVKAWNRRRSSPRTRPGFLRYLGLLD